MTTARVRRVVGRSHLTCPLCRTDGNYLILESRNRLRLPSLFGGDPEVKRYLLCGACKFRSELPGTLDVRDADS